MKYNSIKECRTWNRSDMSRFCMRYDFYTLSTNEQYENMLCFVQNNEPTKENIAIVASMILKYSEMHYRDMPQNEALLELAYLIMDEVVAFYYEWEN